MSEQYLLEMKGICKSFPGVKALQNVDLQLKAGEVHALLGENGAGNFGLCAIFHASACSLPPLPTIKIFI